MLRIGLAGCGYWGKKLLRNLAALDDIRLAVCDPDDAARAYAARYASTLSSYSNLIQRSDAVVIATQPAQHAAMAVQALESKVHVFVEKPMATCLEDAWRMEKAATESRCVLMVGHTFVHNAAVHFLRDVIQSGEIGRPIYGYGQRLNLGIVRKDVGVLWNLGPHDVSIADFLFDGVEFQGVRKESVLPVDVSPHEDVAFLSLCAHDQGAPIPLHIHLSWVDPQKARRMTIVGERKMLVYDDTSHDPIRIYDSRIERQPLDAAAGSFGESRAVSRPGVLTIPRVDVPEPLGVEMRAFVTACREGKAPASCDAAAGRRVVQILEAATR